VNSLNPTHIRWVHGVDFSGAKDAGRKIWIATIKTTGSGRNIQQAEF